MVDEGGKTFLESQYERGSQKPPEPAEDEPVTPLGEVTKAKAEKITDHERRLLLVRELKRQKKQKEAVKKR